MQNAKVLLIDPSNSTFSWHVKNNVELIFHSDQPMEVVTALPQSKIYSPLAGTKTGPNSDQPRDCINIGVLIAQCIEMSPEEVDITKLASLEGIRQITNQTLGKEHRSEDHLFFKEDVVARIRQASDPGVRAEVYKYLTLLDRQIKAAQNFSESDLDIQFRTTAMELFGKPYVQQDYVHAIEEMRKLCGENADIFAVMVKSEI